MVRAAELETGACPTTCSRVTVSALVAAVALHGSQRAPDKALGYRSDANRQQRGEPVGRLAGKQKVLGSIRFGSPLSSLQKIVVYGLCLVTLTTQLMKR